MKIEEASVVVNTVAELFELMSSLSEDEQRAVLDLISQLTDGPSVDQIREEVDEFLNSEPEEEIYGDVADDIKLDSSDAGFTDRALSRLRGFRQAQVYNVLVTAARICNNRIYFSPSEIGRMVLSRFDERDHIITHSSPSALVADPLFELKYLGLVEANGEPGSRNRRYRLANRVNLNVDATFANTKINSACGRRIG